MEELKALLALLEEGKALDDRIRGKFSSERIQELIEADDLPHCFTEGEYAMRVRDDEDLIVLLQRLIVEQRELTGRPLQ